MATSTIPASNPAGNNQMTPAMAMPKTQATVAATPQQNPAMPLGTSIVPSSATAGNGTVPTGTSDLITSGTDHGQNALLKQYTDIYGQGTGASMFQFLNSVGGVNSQVLQDFIKSLAPQTATSEANLGAQLGAMGVSGNSSVAALGEADLQSQINATIAGESASLTEHGEDLTSQMLQGTEQASAQEVASSGWDVFGQVLQGVGNLAGDVVGAGGAAGGFKNLFKF